MVELYKIAKDSIRVISISFTYIFGAEIYMRIGILHACGKHLPYYPLHFIVNFALHFITFIRNVLQHLYENKNRFHE